MKIHVLVVEPDESLLEAHHAYLSAQGFQLAEACTGPDAMSKLDTRQPDVLLLETDLPDSWGERILDYVRRQPEESRVPVIVLSRRDPVPLSYPVQQYFVKPTSMSELARSESCVTHFLLTTSESAKSLAEGN